MAAQEFTIPARKGRAALIKAGQYIAVVNTHGTQVVDTWAFCADDLTECMSMEHSRAAALKLILGIGDSFVTNRRRPILAITADTSPGIHDTLLAACDVERYELLGAHGYHDNCTDNLKAALADLGLETPETPSPLNLFMNIPWTDAGGLSFEPTVSKAGDRITLRAECDCVVAFSCCPQDMVPINGVDMIPKDAAVEIH
tara:strand:+ start:657 stop:1256 length:600 start_codon:yes stop_codon:yes gene_type:complete